MNKYAVMCDSLDRGRVDEVFDAPDDQTAEDYVEENYPADGKMFLVKLTVVCEWPE